MRESYQRVEVSPLRKRKETLASSPSVDEDDSAHSEANRFAPYIVETVSAVDFIFLLFIVIFFVVTTIMLIGASAIVI